VSAQWPSHAMHQLSPLQRDRRRVLLRLAYLSVFFCAALLAAAPDVVAVLAMCDSAYVSGTVTSQAMGFLLAHGRRVLPSGCLLSFSIGLTGSLTAGTCVRLSYCSPQDIVQMAVTLLSRGASAAGESMQPTSIDSLPLCVGLSRNPTALLSVVRAASHLSVWRCCCKHY